MSYSVWPQRLQPTRLLCPWDSPGKNIGVSCHFLLQCMEVKSESEIPQSCPTLSDPMDCSPPGSSVHGIFQARLLEWVALCWMVLNFVIDWFFPIFSFPYFFPHGWLSSKAIMLGRVTENLCQKVRKPQWPWHRESEVKQGRKVWLHVVGGARSPAWCVGYK